MPEVPEGILPLEECLEWADKYKDSPWSSLTLNASAYGDASPAKVFASLVWYARYMHESLQAAQFVLGVEHEMAVKDPERYDETGEGAEIIGETLREIDTLIGPYQVGALAQKKP